MEFQLIGDIPYFLNLKGFQIWNGEFIYKGFQISRVASFDCHTGTGNIVVHHIGVQVFLDDI